MMRVLVSGGKGQLGSEFPAFTNDSRECIALGSDAFNICSSDSINRALTEYQPDVIINCAAYTAVDKAEQEIEAAYAVNRDGVHNLAQACANDDIPLLHISTDYVFSGSKASPYVEADPTDPQGVYGASKLAGEQALQQTWEKHIILRVSWVFGQYGHNFVKTMLRLGSERNELGVVADQHGAPTAARSIAENCLTVAAQMAAGELDWGIYHLPSLPHTTWYAFAERIFSRSVEFGLLETAPTVNVIATSDYPTPAARPANSMLLSNQPIAGMQACDWPAELDRVLHALKV